MGPRRADLGGRGGRALPIRMAPPRQQQRRPGLRGAARLAVLALLLVGQAPLGAQAGYNVSTLVNGYNVIGELRRRGGAPGREDAGLGLFPLSWETHPELTWLPQAGRQLGHRAD